MKIEEKIEQYVTEEGDSILNEKGIVYEDFNNFKQDPLYQEILNSKTKDEFQTKLEKLRDERGEEAVDNFTQLLKSMK